MRKLTGPWLVMITATLIFVPLVANAGDVQGNALAAPTGNGQDSHDPSPAMGLSAAKPIHAVSAPGNRGAMTGAEAPGSFLTLREATIDLPGKHETLLRAVRYPDLLASNDCGSMLCSLIETTFSGHLLQIDARLRHRGPPSSLSVL